MIQAASESISVDLPTQRLEQYRKLPFFERKVDDHRANH